MPELPEVETIKNDLAKKLFKKQIERVWVETSFEKKVSPSVAALIDLAGKTILKITRNAKLLNFDLGEKKLLAHLKMTGQFVFKPEHGKIVAGGHPIPGALDLPNKFTRAIFYFKDSSVLYFNDVRKFGFLKVFSDEDLHRELDKYGIDPFSPKFNFEYFEILTDLRPKAKLKQFLLDQKHIAGLGNIYADEVCFESAVSPLRKMAELTEIEKRKIFSKIKSVLTNGIKHRGTSINTYIDSDGKKGNFQNFLKVYGREGLKCKRCGETIAKIKIGGRSSCFCPSCQK